MRGGENDGHRRENHFKKQGKKTGFLRVHLAVILQPTVVVFLCTGGSRLKGYEKTSSPFHFTLVKPLRSWALMPAGPFGWAHL
jgi:hypothetical protein